MSDEKKFKSIEDLPNYGETFQEIRDSTDQEDQYSAARHLLHNASGSSKQYVENEFKKICAAIDIIKLAQREANKKGTSLITLLEEKAPSKEASGPNKEKE